MSRKWTTRQVGHNQQAPADSYSTGEQEVVLLIQGKNTFGDRIYCYLKLEMPRLAELKERMESGENVDIRQYGDVVAAGLGDPDDETQTEMQKLYGMRPLERGKDFADPQQWMTQEELDKVATTT